MATSEELDAVLGMLSAFYPEWGGKVSPTQLADTVNVYHAALADVPGYLLRMAALNHISHSPWFPKVSELRASALGLIMAGRPTPEEAWGLVRAEIRRAGSYRSPEFDEPLVAEAVRIMGWSDICMAPIDQEGITRAHFMRIYGSLCNRRDDDVIMLPEVRETRNAMLADRVRDKIKSLAGDIKDEKRLSIKGAK